MKRTILLHGTACKARDQKHIYLSLSVAEDSEYPWPQLDIYQSKSDLSQSRGSINDPVASSTSPRSTESSSMSISKRFSVNFSFNSLTSLKSSNSAQSSSRKTLKLDDMFHVSYVIRDSSKSTGIKTFVRNLSTKKSTKEELAPNFPNEHDDDQTNALFLFCQSTHKLAFIFPSKDVAKEWHDVLTSLVTRLQFVHGFPVITAAWPARLKMKFGEESPKQDFKTQTKLKAGCSVYICFTPQELFIVLNSVRHPEFIIQYQFVRLTGCRQDGVFELHLGRASPLGECEIHFKLHDTREASQVSDKCSKLLSLRQKMQMPGVRIAGGRKRTRRDGDMRSGSISLNYASMYDPMELGPPLPSLVRLDSQGLDKISNKSESELTHSRKNSQPRVRQQHSTSNNRQEEMALQLMRSLYMSPQLANSSTDYHHLFSNLVTSKSLNLVHKAVESHQTEEASRDIKMNMASTLIPIIENTTLDSSTEAPEDKEASSTLQMAIGGGLSQGAGYVDLDSEGVSNLCLNREEILKRPPRVGGPLDLDNYTRALADHESKIVSLRQSKSSTSSVIDMETELSSSSQSSALLEENVNLLKQGSAPDKKTIMWVLSYLMMTRENNTMDSGLPANECAASDQQQKRAFSFNKTLPNQDDSIPSACSISQLISGGPSKRITIGACANEQKFLLQQQQNQSHKHHETAIQQAAAVEKSLLLACKLLPSTTRSTSRLGSFSLTTTNSSERSYSSRNSLVLKKTRLERTGNRANDDLFATVSFDITGQATNRNLAPATVTQEPKVKTRARTASDVVSYRGQLNALTHALLKQSLYQNHKSVSIAQQEPSDDELTGPAVQHCNVLSTNSTCNRSDLIWPHSQYEDYIVPVNPAIGPKND